MNTFRLALVLALLPLMQVTALEVTGVTPETMSADGPVDGVLRVTGSDFMDASELGSDWTFDSLRVFLERDGTRVAPLPVAASTNSTITCAWSGSALDGLGGVYDVVVERKSSPDSGGGSVTDTARHPIRLVFTRNDALSGVVVPGDLNTLARGGQLLVFSGLFTPCATTFLIEFDGFAGGSGVGTFVGTRTPDLDNPAMDTRLLVVAPPMGLALHQFDPTTVTLTAPDLSKSTTNLNFINYPALPLRIEVADPNFVPITNATVLLKRPDAPLGSRATFERVGPFGFWGQYVLPFADRQTYDVFIHAPGFMPAGPFPVAPQTSESAPGAVARSVNLQPDPNFMESSQIQVEIEIVALNLVGAAPLLITDTVDLLQGGMSLGLDPVCGPGTLTFLGVPPGLTEVMVPDTPEYTFDSQMIQIGTGVRERVTLMATPVTPFPPEGTVARADFPGQILGFVNVTATPQVLPLENSMVVSTQLDSGITMLAFSGPNGFYFHPDVVAGTGVIQAFSPNGNIFGPAKPVLIVAGQQFGDDLPIPEDSDLEVPMDTTDTTGSGTIEDTDGDGMSDVFETTMLSGLSAADAQASADPDLDGLSNLEEFVAGTDPQNANTDGDAGSFKDGMEIVLGSDPKLSTSNPVLPDPVYVDFGYTDLVQAGSLGYPWPTLDAAVAAAGSGATIRIKGDVVTTVGGVPAGAISKPLTIEAFNGTVRIGG